MRMAAGPRPHPFPLLFQLAQPSTCRAKDELDGLREKVVALVDPPTAQPVAQEAVEEIFENITY